MSISTDKTERVQAVKRMMIELGFPKEAECGELVRGMAKLMGEWSDNPKH